MTHDNGYVREKLVVALMSMSKSDNSLKQRLEDAYTSSLIQLSASDFCEGDQQDFQSLKDAMCRVENSEIGFATASIAEMSDGEVKEWINKICAFVFGI